MTDGIPMDTELTNEKKVDLILALGITKSLERTMKGWPECLDLLHMRASAQRAGRPYSIETSRENLLISIGLLERDGSVSEDTLAVLDATLVVKDGHVRAINDPFTGERILDDLERLTVKPSRIAPVNKLKFP